MKRCQNYFCVEETKEKKCPIVDIYSTKIKKIENTDYYQTNDVIPQFTDTDVNLQNIFSATQLEEDILLPITNVLITKNEKCASEDKNSMTLDYGAVKNTECPIDQRVHLFYQQGIDTVLNNNDNYYNNTLKTLPLFDKIVNKEIK